MPTPARGKVRQMDEEIFNMELRKFLKTVGVTSQREIETAVSDALASGKLKGPEALKVKAVLSIESLGLRHDIEGDTKLGGGVTTAPAWPPHPRSPRHRRDRKKSSTEK